MEAKDTIIITNPYNSGSEKQPERLCWMAYEEGKNDQAEVSFKAGKNDICPDCGLCGGICLSPDRSIRYCQWDNPSASFKEDK